MCAGLGLEEAATMMLPQPMAADMDSPPIIEMNPIMYHQVKDNPILLLGLGLAPGNLRK